MQLHATATSVYGSIFQIALMSFLSCYLFEWGTGDSGNLVAAVRASLLVQSDLTELCMAHLIAILHIYPEVNSPTWDCKVYDRR